MPNGKEDVRSNPHNIGCAARATSTRRHAAADVAGSLAAAEPFPAALLTPMGVAMLLLWTFRGYRFVTQSLFGGCLCPEFNLIVGDDPRAMPFELIRGASTGTHTPRPTLPRLSRAYGNARERHAGSLPLRPYTSGCWPPPCRSNCTGGECRGNNNVALQAGGSDTLDLQAGVAAPLTHPVVLLGRRMCWGGGCLRPALHRGAVLLGNV